jgi:hypothetical protein
MGKYPIAPTVTQIGRLGFSQVFFDEIVALGKVISSLVRLVQLETSQRSDCGSLGPNIEMRAPGREFSPINCFGATIHAQFRKRFATLEIRERIRIRATARHGNFRQFAWHLQFRAWPGKDETILRHAIGGVGIRSAGKPRSDFLADLLVRSGVPRLHQQRGG